MKAYLAAGALVALSTFGASFRASAQERKATVTSESAGLYARPSASEKIQGIVPALTRVKVLDQEGNWYVVRVLDRVGWMPGHSIAFAGRSPAIGSAASTLLGASSASSTGSRSSAASRNYIRGPRGGCYYVTASGSKRYVDRSLCN